MKKLVSIAVAAALLTMSAALFAEEAKAPAAKPAPSAEVKKKVATKHIAKRHRHVRHVKKAANKRAEKKQGIKAKAGPAKK